ncbi:50S ribosomal protein L15 [Thermodesulfobacterium sp. TA1]|uniref:50S ribosomal protein L15 n=1 Tax=Thermodesulfobacterium sp. TA1 TaxID=2234087 RepID=UPI0012325940|nr:50S ribosomal protein L15 [Thermodesulfobacterium sp. TA1]
MTLDELKPFAGSKHKDKRVGRGHGSGHGKTSCKGHKGQKARRGLDIAPWFEGGQTTIIRRVPKRGFTNIFKKEYELVNIKDLAERFESNDLVDLESLQLKGLVKGKNKLVKLLGDGEIDKPLVVKVHAVSKAAKEKIEKAGGKVEIVKV